MNRYPSSPPGSRAEARPDREREFFIDNLLVQIHFIIETIWWPGLAPREFEFPFSGSLISTFLRERESFIDTHTATMYIYAPPERMMRWCGCIQHINSLNPALAMPQRCHARRLKREGGGGGGGGGEWLIRKRATSTNPTPNSRIIFKTSRLTSETRSSDRCLPWSRCFFSRSSRAWAAFSFQQGDSWSGGCGQAVTQMCSHIVNVLNLWQPQGCALSVFSLPLLRFLSRFSCSACALFSRPAWCSRATLSRSVLSARSRAAHTPSCSRRLCEAFSS